MVLVMKSAGRTRQSISMVLMGISGLLLLVVSHVESVH